MGQRSQIFVRFEKELGEKEIVARYFNWNYGERMISKDLDIILQAVINQAADERHEYITVERIVSE